MNHTADRFYLHSFLHYARLIVLPMLLCTLLGLSISVLYTTNETDVMENAMLAHLETGMNYILEEMDAFVLELDQESVFRSASDILRCDGLTYERFQALNLLRDMLSSRVNARPYIDSVYIYITNPHDRVLHSMDGVNIISSMHDREWLQIFQERCDRDQVWTQRRLYPKYRFENAVGLQQETVSIFRAFRTNRGMIVLNLSPQYVQNQLEQLVSHDDQLILILNAEGQLLFSNLDSSSAVMTDELHDLVESGGASFHYQQYTGMLLSGSKYGWQYVSLVPTAVLNRMMNSMVTLFACLIMGGICLCLLLAYHQSQQQAKRLHGIIEVLDAARAGKELPFPARKGDDEYTYIEENIITNYARQHQLEMQLQDKNYQLKSYELLALQAQINPHFLVNTLNTIFWQAMGLTDGPNPVTEMIEALTGMLDYIASDPNTLVCLEDEVRYLDDYISIQKKRFPNSFDFSTELSPNCAALRIPRLILQPLAENCITHARVPDRVVHIRLSGQIVDGKAEISVSDDGCGMTEETLRELHSQLNGKPTYKHIGLVNTIKRLNLLYDLDDAVQVESTLGKGTTILIRLPVVSVDR